MCISLQNENLLSSGTGEVFVFCRSSIDYVDFSERRIFLYSITVQQTMDGNDDEGETYFSRARKRPHMPPASL